MDARTFLLAAAREGTLSHAYLVVGGSADEVERLVRQVAEVLGVTASDLHTVESDGAIPIEGVRTLIHDLSLRPHSSPRKIALIKNAQKMTQEAQNALLKTLEEPPGDTTLVLSVPAEGGVLSTIASRCQKLRLSGEERVPEDDIPELVEIAAMPLVERFKLAEELSKKDDLLEVVDGWLLSLRKVFDNDAFAAELAESVFGVKKMLADTNVNRRLLLEQLFLELAHDR